MNTFIKKLMGFSLGPIIGALIAFITIPLTTFFIEPSEYGKASMFSTMQIILGTFIYLGIDQSYTREYHSEKNKLNLLQNAVFVPLLLSVFFFLIILIFPSKVSFLLFESTEFISASILFGLMIIAMVIERFILLSIRMEEKALEYSILNVIIKLAVLIFTLLFVIFIRTDFLAIVYSAVFGQLLGDIYLVIRYRKLFDISNFIYNKSLLIKMLKFGLPILVATSLSSILNSFDRISLRVWSTFYEIGIFTATLKIAATLSIVQTSFTSFWVPTAYRWYEEKKEIIYYKIVSDSILLVMSILFYFILFFKSIIVSILSSNYSEAIHIIAFLCLQPIIYTISETTCLGITFSRKSYLSILVGVISILPNVLINIILVPKYGSLGAAIATAVSYFVFFVIRTKFSNMTGMRFSTFKHNSVILIMFIGAIVNITNNSYILLMNFLLFSLTLFLQIPTVKNLFNYKKLLAK